MRHLLAVACSICSLTAFSQVFPPVTYPRDYFRDPLNIPISLAANFGELRPNHYHMGLDIRTQKKVNLPVFAAADGYVTRVVIEPAGFGQAIYLRHPNGYTTLYAHLNRFFPALAAYVREQQYKLESWQVSLEIPPALFPVKKGEQIAFSGSTGGSQGPHLHFEIRRTEGDVNLNPLLFGLPVPDNTTPTIQRLAWYDRGQSIYEQSPHILPVQKTGAGFSINPGLLIVPVPRISFSIAGFDTQTGSANPNGIFQSVLYKDDQPVIGFQMDNISYNDTRNINAHIDYKTRATGGPFLQQLSFLSGYPSPSVYRSFTGTGTPSVDPAAAVSSRTPAAASSSVQAPDGVIDLRDGRPHNIRIEVKDAYGNASTLSWRVQYQAPALVPHPPVPSGKLFYPGMVDGVETADCAFYTGEKSLYDSVHIDHIVAGYPGSGLSLPGGVSAVHTIGAVFIPLLEPLLVRLRPIPAVLKQVGPLQSGSGLKEQGTIGKREKVVMVRFHGADRDVVLPEWQDGWASARFREFGNFQLVEDTVPPVITPIGISDEAVLTNAPRIAFTVKDNLGALRHFRAELDGKWLCFTNDKGLAFIYIFDEACPPGRHVLKVMVEDVAGNKSEKEYRFTR